MGDTARHADGGAHASQAVSPSVRRVIRVGLAFAAFTALSVCTGVAQTWRTLSSARQVHGEHALDVHVRYGAGKFTLSQAPAGTLYRMDMTYDEDRQRPIHEYDPASSALEVGVRNLNDHGVSWSRRHNEEAPTFDLALAAGLPVDLDIEIGAAQASAELGGLSIRSLHYTTGASESTLRFGTRNPVACDELTVEVGAAALHALGLANAGCRRLRFSGGVGELELDFSGVWHQPVDASVSVGIGSLKLHIPRDVGVALHLNRFLTSFEQAGFVRRGDNWYSANFQTARNRLNLDVNASFGGVEVSWID